jgi:hypothetical protein
MNTILSTPSIATAEAYCYLEEQVQEIAPEPITIRTAKRKARYHDKSRIRLKDIKAEALLKCGCKSSAEIKQCLKALKLKMDLRYTCSWSAIAKELHSAIAAVKRIIDLTAGKDKQPHLPEIKVGNKVNWEYVDPRLCYLEQWFPLEVLSIANGEAQLELLSRLVPVSQLTLVTA